METVAYLKRPTPTTSTLCLISQADKKDSLRDPLERGFQRLQESARDRLKFHDRNNRDIIDRVIDARWDKEPVWHGSCYSWFTNRNKIARLDQPCCNPASIPRTSAKEKPRLRSEVTPLDSMLCVFCQTVAKRRFTRSKL